MSKTSLRSRAALLALGFAALTSLASAAAGPWTARLRATYLDMANKSDAFTALGINFAADSVSINSKWIPEFDFTYAFTPNLSAELVLTIPQSQEVTLRGVGKLGKFKHLPPTLLAQYNFAPGATVQPYIGAGVNFTLIFDTDLKVTTVGLDLEDYSVGLAGQAGVNIKLSDTMHLNLDVKRAALGSDVSVKGGPRLTTANLDPWLFSVGLGWQF